MCDPSAINRELPVSMFGLEKKRVIKLNYRRGIKYTGWKKKI